MVSVPPAWPRLDPDRVPAAPCGSSGHHRLGFPGSQLPARLPHLPCRCCRARLPRSRPHQRQQQAVVAAACWHRQRPPRSPHRVNRRQWQQPRLLWRGFSTRHRGAVLRLCGAAPHHRGLLWSSTPQAGTLAPAPRPAEAPAAPTCRSGVCRRSRPANTRLPSCPDRRLGRTLAPRFWWCQIHCRRRVLFILCRPRRCHRLRARWHFRRRHAARSTHSCLRCRLRPAASRSLMRPGARPQHLGLNRQR